MTTLADRIDRVEPSATLAISNLAAELSEGGADVVNLSVGEPDFATPEHIVRAAKTALDEGHTGYTPSNGIPALREAIAARLAEAGAGYDPDQVVVTPGAKQALYEAINTLVDDGDEVVLLDPAWVSYAAMVKLAGGTLRRVDLTPHGFQLEPALEEVEAAMSADTAVVIVNSPCNPTGAVYTEAAITDLGAIAEAYDATIISDEIYERIVYDVEPTTTAALDGLGERTVTVNGFSKAYSMTGWRLGYLAGPADVVAGVGKVHSHSVSCAANFVQHAGVEALEGPEEPVEAMVDAFRSRRDLLVDLLEEADVDVTVPDGAFYLMVPVDADDAAWCESVIREAHVATVPGGAFGAPGYARLSYANSESRLREAVDRLVDGGFL